MKRYDINVEDFGGLTAPYLDITEQVDGKWVKWEDHEKKVTTLERMNRKLFNRINWLLTLDADDDIETGTAADDFGIHGGIPE